MNAKKIIEKETEIKILEAAKSVFVLKGMDGARMQEIADQAGINKALLHYYFRSKEKLFLEVFKKEAAQFLPKQILILLSHDDSFESRISRFIKNYLDLFIRNPFLPLFIFSEANRNPEMVTLMFQEAGVNPERLTEVVGYFSAELQMNHLETVHFIVNVLSMCVFPFVARTVLQGLLFKSSESEFQQFINERHRYVTDFVMNSVKNRNPLMTES